MADLLTTLLALFACYCFVRAALLIPRIWRDLRDAWNNPPSTGWPQPPPPPDPAVVARQQREMNIARYRNAKERRLYDAR